MPKSITIAGVEIQQGDNLSLNIDLPKLYHTPTKLPIQVIRGKREGPTVFISASIHGDELNGIEIIRRIKKLNVLKRLKGTLILIPMVNIYGVMTQSRYMPDRRDLNRSFPGTKRGSLASRVAKTFFEEIVKKCDLGIDLHTASIHKSNFPQIRTNINDSFTYNLAKIFEAPLVLHAPLREGSLRSEAMEVNVPILLYEAGEALRFDETSIRIGVKGIVNVLRELKMFPAGHPRSRKLPIVTKSSQWIRATDSGILRTIKKLGDTVKEEEVIAYIDDPIDDNNSIIKAPFDGVIIGKSEIPLIQEGDAIFHIARFKNLETAENKIEYFSEDAIETSEFHELNDEEMIE